MKRISTFFLAGILALTSSCQSKSPHPGKSIGIEEFPEAKDLYHLAERQREKHDLPALGIGIVRDGKIIGLGMAGERKLGSGEWATLNDRFDVASCSKSLTATIAAMLVEKGVARWDMTIKEVFPEMQESILPAYSDVTLEMFLRHRSGLERWMSTNERWSEWSHDHRSSTPTKSRRLFTASVLKNQPRHAPGADTYYCNDGYLVAGSMMEKVSGKSWEDLVQQMLFVPLGLHSMRFGFPSSKQTTTVVSGHGTAAFGRTVSVKSDPDKYGDPPFGAPGGFLYSTVADLLRFTDLHIQGDSGSSNLLSRESFVHLHTPLENQHFAMGWEVETKRNRQSEIVERSIYHGGFSGSSRANMWFCPESRTGTVIVYNHGGDDKADAYVEIFYALLQEFGLGGKE